MQKRKAQQHQGLLPPRAQERWEGLACPPPPPSGNYPAALPGPTLPSSVGREHTRSFQLAVLVGTAAEVEQDSGRQWRSAPATGSLSPRPCGCLADL